MPEFMVEPDRVGLLNQHASAGETAIRVHGFAGALVSLNRGDVIRLASNTQCYAIVAETDLVSGEGVMQITPPLVQNHCRNDFVTLKGETRISHPVNHAWIV